MQDLITIEFYGDAILAVETDDGEHLVAVKPICERLGLDWSAQLKKLKSASDRWGVAVIAIPSASGVQETTCLPVSKIAGWLATIHLSRVAQDTREALTLYQNEADRVLDRHFRLRAKELSAELEEARELQRRSACMALAHSARMNKIARLKEAGVTWLDMAAAIGLPKDQTDDILVMMTDAGLIDTIWSDRRMSRDELARIRWPRANRANPVDEARAEMGQLFPEA